MKYVNPEDVMKLFILYIDEYGDVLSKGLAISELQDALDDAEYEEID